MFPFAPETQFYTGIYWFVLCVCYHSIIAIFLHSDSIGELNSYSDESAQLLMIITHKMTLKMFAMSLTTYKYHFWGEDVDPILLSIATP